ncbi:MAG: iron permease [Burkholderiales bacterium]|nr:MAG: iron permease [Burkholderiales bacterium]
MNQQRRTLIIYAATASSVAAATAFAQKATPELVKDSDANAVALGYSSDASKTDVKKYPQYAAGQSCSGCTLYAGTVKDANAACPIFGGKFVSGKGWCSAWVKKA